MKKTLLSIFLSVLVLIILLITIAPAKVIIPTILDKLPKNLQGMALQDISGTIWTPKVGTFKIKEYQLNNITFDIKPLSLMMGDLNADIKINDPLIKLTSTLEANSTKVTMREGNYEVVASWFDPFMAFPVKGIEGVITGSLEKLEVSNNQAINELNGVGSWRNAFILYLDQQLNLGDIKYQLSTTEAKDIKLDILENVGGLGLKGYLTLSPDRTYKLNISTKQDLPETISVWVQRIAKFENDRYHIVWGGKLQ